MTPVLLYILKSVFASGLLYGYYWFFLRNRQFHRYNRFYLLIISLMSVIIPFFTVPFSLPGVALSNGDLEKTLRVISVNNWEDSFGVNSQSHSWSQWFTLKHNLLFLYIVGVIVGGFMILNSVGYILRIKKKYPHETIHDIKFYHTVEKGAPFSFFRLIFWNRAIPLETREGQQIFRHELFHVQEKHSSDTLLMELLCCLAWFNPFFHLIKKEIKAVHEFQADDYALAGSNRHEYAALLVLQAIKRKTAGLTNPFFHHQLKRRITMITQLKKIRHGGGYISRLMVLPLMSLLFCAFALKLTHSTARNPLSKPDPITVLIDAGHGGIDAGAKNEDGKAEKDIVLSIAKKIKQLAGQYNIHVELSRDADILPGNAKAIREGLIKRVEMVRETNASLFISIHMNASTGAEPTAAGIEAFISASNDVSRSKNLAAALLQKLSTVYNTSSVLKQRTEKGIWVLDKSTCPAVLLECGNLSMKEDVMFISDPQNQEKIAKVILQGIALYAASGTPLINK